MIDDELDLHKSHWDDALSSSSIHSPLEQEESKDEHKDDNVKAHNEDSEDASQHSFLSSSTTETSQPSITASKNKHNRTTTLRSSRFNKKAVYKVPVESVSSSDPLGPLGYGSNEPEPASEPLARSYIDKNVVSGINHFNANNERLALFGEDKNQAGSKKPLSAQSSADDSGLVKGVGELSVEDDSNLSFPGKGHASKSSVSSTDPQLNTFDITVGDPIKVGDITSAHTVYTVHTKTNSPNFANVETNVTRRYRDFRWLYHALENNNPGVIIPPPPEKQAVGRFDEDFVESRRSALENMLNKCSTHPVLQNDPDFRIFLESETFSTDIKSKQYQTQASGYSGSESKGFMGSLGGAFSFSGKFVETDEWFLEKKTYVDTLESQLKYLEKSLDAVVSQRKELSDATAEFANILSSLSQVELSKSFGELIEQFSAVELRVRDLYYRQCMQDILSIGTTLEEYIRLITSIRNVFSQRQKSYFTLQVAEQDLVKKRSHLEKVMKQGKTMQDKISALKQDVSDQEKKVVNLRVAFDDICKLIISEFRRFEILKANDFRNAVELFLENAVEAQKEAIEIWETFYQRSGFVSVN